ncbi:MAG: hypothetical protein SOR77_08025 [Peptoniphilus sp.]|uniref:hypothetical protein n=1 Tax=Peptoniphilus sp. TaxID=1971214 RepID=UPI002A75B1E9|nr:hypothetical protein [Peptoniphilus sp.]MDY2987564.1 hypothetical protein [Peptoniphilus sp.]
MGYKKLSTELGQMVEEEIGGDTDNNIYDLSSDRNIEKEENELNNLLTYFNSKAFEKNDVIEALNKIENYEKTNGRFLYSIITDFCYGVDNMDTINGNIKFLYAHSLSNNENENIKKIVLKLYDHLQLVAVQKGRSESIEQNINGNLKDAAEDLKKAMEEIEALKNDIKNTKENFTSQLISLIAIFIAVAFVIFGGLSSLSNISEPLNTLISLKGEGKDFIPVIYKTFTLWFLGMFNILYLFMHFVSKLINKKLVFYDVSDKKWCELAKFIVSYHVFFLINIVGFILITRIF